MHASPPDGALNAEAGARVWPMDRAEEPGRGPGDRAGRPGRGAWRLWATALIFGSAVAGIAILVMLPLSWHIPELAPIRLSGMEGQVSGTYLQAGDALFKLVPYNDRLPALPRKLPVADASASFLVRARQLDEPQAYALLTFAGDREVAVERARKDARTIALAPLQPLAPGAYYVRAAKDGADRADEYFYFKVE